MKFKDVLKAMSRGRKLAMEVAQDVCAAGPGGWSEDEINCVQKNIARAQDEFISDENISYQLLNGVDDPDAYTTEDVIEIFIRANSGGTKLGKSDLLFSLLASEWALADEEMEELLEELNRTGYRFDRDFVLKQFLVMLGQGTKYEVTKFRKPEVREAFVTNWAELSDAIKAASDFLHGKTFLKSDKAAPSYLGLIPLIYLRYTYPDKWNVTAEKRHVWPETVSPPRISMSLSRKQVVRGAGMTGSTIVAPMRMREEPPPPAWRRRRRCTVSRPV